MPRFLRSLVAGIVLATWVTHAWAIDPIALFLLNMLRNRIATEIAERIIEEAMKPPAVERYIANPPRLTPQEVAETERRKLRRLIDDSFAYLSDAERQQVFAGVSQVLADAAYESQRADILAEFTQTARAMGEAYRVLRTLSSSEKREIAAQAGAQFRKLSPQDQEELGAHLRARRLPLPGDLSDMLLAEVAVRNQTTTAVVANPSNGATPVTSVLE
jgi:uncharacterized protein (DUF2267 family)